MSTTLLFATGLATALQPASDAALEEHVRAGRPGMAEHRSGGISANDYPAAALRAGAQGAVDMRLTIGTQGRIENCEIVRSSGHAILDETACSLATRRWVFFPAIGADGRPRTETRVQRVAWRLPGGEARQRDSDLERHLRAARPGPARLRAGSVSEDDYPAAARLAGAEGAVATRFMVGPNGRVVSCAVAESSGNVDLDTVSCLIVIDRFQFLPAISAEGRPVAEWHTQRFVWRLPPPPPPESRPAR